MSNRIRYTRDNIISNKFLQLPRFLLDHELAELTNDARVLYALLRDRHEVSIKNGWYDDNDEVYLHYRRDDMQSALHVSENMIRLHLIRQKSHDHIN